MLCGLEGNAPRGGDAGRPLFITWYTFNAVTCLSVCPHLVGYTYVYICDPVRACDIPLSLNILMIGSREIHNIDRFNTQSEAAAGPSCGFWFLVARDRTSAKYAACPAEEECARNCAVMGVHIASWIMSLDPATPHTDAPPLACKRSQLNPLARAYDLTPLLLPPTKPQAGTINQKKKADTNNQPGV